MRARFATVPACVGRVKCVNQCTRVGRHSAAGERWWSTRWIGKHRRPQGVKCTEEVVVEDVNLIDVVSAEQSDAVVSYVINFEHGMPTDFALEAHTPLIALGRTQGGINDVNTVG